MSAGPRFWACKRCREKHRKCSGPPWPCEECRREGVPCERDKRRGTRRRGPINSIMRELQSGHTRLLGLPGTALPQGGAAVREGLIPTLAFGFPWPFGGGRVFEVCAVMSSAAPGGAQPWPPLLRYQRIQMAIDCAADGDTILVYPGLYRERIEVHQSVRLLAATPPPWLPPPSDVSASAAAPLSDTTVPLSEMEGVAVLLPPLPGQDGTSEGGRGSPSAVSGAHERAPPNALVRFSPDSVSVFGGFVVIQSEEEGEQGNAHPDGSMAVLVESGSVHVSTCDIRNERGRGERRDDALRVRSPFANLTVERCRLSAAHGSGVVADDCGHVSVLSSAIVRCGEAGVSFGARRAPPKATPDVVRSAAAAPGGGGASSGIRGQTSEHYVLRGCSVGRCGGAGAVVVGNIDLCVVEGNSLWENSADVVDADGRSLAGHPAVQRRNRLGAASPSMPLLSVRGSLGSLSGMSNPQSVGGGGGAGGAPAHAASPLVPSPVPISPLVPIGRTGGGTPVPLFAPTVAGLPRSQAPVSPPRALAESPASLWFATQAEPAPKRRRLHEGSAREVVHSPSAHLLGMSPTRMAPPAGVPSAAPLATRAEVDVLRNDVRLLSERVAQLEALLRR